MSATDLRPEEEAAPASTSKGNRLRHRVFASYGARQVLVVAVLVLIWGFWVELREVNPLLVPAPRSVATEFVAMLGSGELLAFTAATLRLLLTGLGIGIAAAFVLTGLAIFIPFARTVLVTLAAMFNPLPSVALLPLALLWFGIGSAPIVFVVFYSVIWAMALNLNAGFETVPTQLRWVGQNLGLARWQNVANVFLPAALPAMLTGFRLSWAYGWRTVIAAELVFGAMGGSGGLGWMIVVERYNLNSARVFVGLITIIMIGLAVEAIFNFVENRTTRRWGMAA